MSAKTTTPIKIDGVSDSILAKANALRGTGDYTPEAGLSYANSTAYFDTAPAGWTPELSKAVKRHDTEWAVAAHIAGGWDAVDIMAAKGNKELAAVPVAMPFGHHAEFEVQFERRRTFVNHMSPTKEEVVRTAYANGFKLVNNSAGGGAALKRARTAISDYGLDQLK